MPKQQDIIGAISILRAAGIRIDGNERVGARDSMGRWPGGTSDSRDFGGMGYADIVGELDDDDDDDDDEVRGVDIIGAIVGLSRGNRLTRKQKKALKQMAKQQKKQGQQEEFKMLAQAMSTADKPGVRTDADFTLRGLTLGMGTVSVPNGGINTLNARAQEAIRIQRIELDPNGASFANLFVTSIVVGVRPQSANLQEMPLVSFAFNATGSYLRGNTVDRGQDFQINLRNAQVAPVSVTGVVFGDSLQP